MAKRQSRYSDLKSAPPATYADLHQINSPQQQRARQGPAPQTQSLHGLEPRAILDSALYRKAESALKDLLTDKSKPKPAQPPRKPVGLSSPRADLPRPAPRTTAFSAGQSRSASNRPVQNDVREIHQARGQFLRAILNTGPAAPPRLLQVQKPESKEKDAKQEAANSLKHQLLQRFRAQDPEEPPHDLLSMSVLERSQQFLQHREARRKEQQETKKAREVEECTFHPILYTQISPKDMNRSTKELLALSFEKVTRPRGRTRSLSRPKTQSYSQLHQRGKLPTPTGTPRSQPRRRSTTNALLTYS